MARRAAPVSYRTESGLDITVERPGAGPAVQRGNEVRIHESTALADGTIVFSTFESRLVMKNGAIVKGATN